MNHARVLYHLVRADFLDRVRRYSFLLTLGFAAYLAYAAGTGKIVVRLDEYQGVLNSAWCGSMMTLVSTLFLSLVGFYIVKNAILRDEQTRVGRILAATPMTPSFYTLAKALSNFAVLSAMLAVLASAAVILQLARSQHYPIQPLVLLAPFIWVGLPAMAFTAAIAVLFETVPGLRAGLGNVIYFFAWTASLGLGIDRHMDDVGGFTVIGRDMQKVLTAMDSAYKQGLSITISDQTVPTRTFLWTGVNWTPAIVLHRMIWAAAALGVALLAAQFFHRFDPAREYFWRKKEGIQPATNGNGEAAIEPATSPAILSAHLTPMIRSARGVRFPHLVLSELRLMLKGHRWWWYAIAAGLLVGQLVAPDVGTRQGFWLASWLWPVLVWSQMGSREARYATQSLIFSSEAALYRQLPAVWVAGLMVTALAGGGMGLRLLISGDARAFVAWLAGALFVPSLAVALGVWSGSSKPFEALYTALWYVGPANHTPGVDFMGITAESRDGWFFLLAAGALLAAAYAGRRTRLGYV